MELLVWHDELGSDDEQATDEERTARLLYAYLSPDSPRVAGAASDDAMQLQEARGMHALQFMEALVAFTRLLRRPSPQGSLQWVSAVLATRRFYIQEVEPHVFFALGVKTADLSGDELRSVHATVLQQIYDIFCLFHGRIDRQLRELPPLFASRFDDGLALLQRIGIVRRRLRKISIERELDEHDAHEADDNTRTERLNEQTQLQQELQELVASSPSRTVWSRCDALFPTLLSVMEVNRLSMFHQIDGVAYFPMDESTFLSMQSLIDSFLAELKAIVSGGIALFYKGNVIWRTIDAPAFLNLQRFLCLREQDGMDMTSPQSRSGDLWMARKYDDAFSPIWASKTSYAECAIVHRIAPQPRRTGRSIHKQTPLSLNTLANELADANSDAPAICDELRQIRKSQRYRSDAPVYRNRGFLTKSDGYFLPSWELAKAGSNDVVWAPTVFPLHNSDAASSTALFYHENDLSILVLTQPSATSTAVLQHMEKIADCLEKLQFTAMASTIWKSYLAMTGSQPSRDKSSSTSQPHYIYLNRINRAFKVSDQIPRLVKSKDADLYPRPASLWAHYFSAASLELLNDAHEALQSDEETVELRVKTVNDGWLVAHRSRASDREWYALLDTKTASVTDAQDATTELLAAQFSNIYL